MDNQGAGLPTQASDTSAVDGNRVPERGDRVQETDNGPHVTLDGDTLPPAQDQTAAEGDTPGLAGEPAEGRNPAQADETGGRRTKNKRRADSDDSPNGNGTCLPTRARKYLRSAGEKSGGEGARGDNVHGPLAFRTRPPREDYAVRARENWWTGSFFELIPREEEEEEESSPATKEDSAPGPSGSSAIDSATPSNPPPPAS